MEEILLSKSMVPATDEKLAELSKERARIFLSLVDFSVSRNIPDDPSPTNMSEIPRGKGNETEPAHTDISQSKKKKRSGLKACSFPADMVAQFTKYMKGYRLEDSSDNWRGFPFFRPYQLVQNGHYWAFKKLHELYGCKHCCEYTSQVFERPGQTNDLEMCKWINANCEKSARMKMSPNPISHAAEGGHLELVEWFHHNRTDRSDADAIRTAAMQGHLHVVEWLFHNRKNGAPGLAEFVTQTGQLRVLEWANENMPGEKKRSSFSVLHAAKNGHLNCLEYIHRRRTQDPFPRKCFDVAASNGHLHVIEWLHRTKKIGGTKEAMIGAAKKGHLNVLEWLHTKNKNKKWTSDVADAAASEGKAQVLEWLLYHHRKEGYSSKAVEDVISSGNMPVLRLLHLNDPGTGAAWTSSAADIAAAKGNLSALEFLFNHRSEGCTTQAMDKAAGIGHLQVVRYLHSKGAKCTASALDGAASNGHLAVVEYLHSIKAESSERAAESAAKNGHVSVLQFLNQHRSEGCVDPTLMDEAASKGDLETVKLLHEMSCSCTTKAADSAAANGHFSTLKFLLENRSEGCTTKAMDGAAAEKKMDVVKLLHKHSFTCSTDAIDIVAGKHDAVEMVRWLLDNTAAGCTERATINAVWGWNWGAVAVLEALHARGATAFPPHLLENSARRPTGGTFGTEVPLLDRLQWLHSVQQLEPLMTSTIKNRAVIGLLDYSGNEYRNGGRLDTIEWLHNQFPSIHCTSHALFGVTEKGLLTHLEWLYKHERQLFTRANLAHMQDCLAEDERFMMLGADPAADNLLRRNYLLTGPPLRKALKYVESKVKLTGLLY